MGMKELIIKIDDPSERAWDGSQKVFETKELVRCNDCKYGSLWSDEQVIVCDKLSKTRDKNWFCADGERKEGGEENEKEDKTAD